MRSLGTLGAAAASALAGAGALSVIQWVKARTARGHAPDGSQRAAAKAERKRAAKRAKREKKARKAAARAQDRAETQGETPLEPSA